MTRQWREGFSPLRVAKLTADEAMAVLIKLPSPSPEELLEASKNKKNPFYPEFWSEGDQIWASRARLDHARKIIGEIRETVVVGGKSIEVRAVEYVRPNGAEGSWAHLDDIRRDPDMMDAYLSEIQRLQEQAAGKMAKFRELSKANAV